MKKALLFIIFIICSAQLYSAEPLVKFYLQDGSSKQYNLSDIDNMKFPNAPDTLQFKIFKNNSKNLYYPAQLIDSIKVSIDNSNENRLHLWHDGFIWDVAIHEIDSILIYYTTHVAVTIGEQHWMYRNLNVDHYRNGDAIPEVRDSSAWYYLTTGAWCNYNNDSTKGAIYGKLYNWYAVNDPRGLAPVGWFIPIDAEWKDLEMSLGITLEEADREGGRGIDQGGKVKCTGTKEVGDGLWFRPNTGASNESGFSALPGALRGGNGNFGNVGLEGIWWCLTESWSTSTWTRFLRSTDSRIYRFVLIKEFGFSVRCIKDN